MRKEYHSGNNDQLTSFARTLRGQVESAIRQALASGANETDAAFLTTTTAWFR